MNYYKAVPGEYEALVWTDELTAEDLVELRDHIEAAVRAKLELPYADLSAAKLYDHSMGQSLQRGTQVAAQ